MSETYHYTLSTNSYNHIGNYMIKKIDIRSQDKSDEHKQQGEIFLLNLMITRYEQTKEEICGKQKLRVNEEILLTNEVNKAEA